MTLWIPALLAVGQPSDGSMSPWASFLPLVLIFVIFYFLLIAPARKKQRAHADMLNALKNGDKVVTTGGLHGTVVGVSDKVVQIRIADKIKVEVAKHAVAGLRDGDG